MAQYVTIVNGAPAFLPLGNKDSSTRELQSEPLARPTHLPKYYIYAQKGPLGPQLLGADARVMVYGQDTFDETLQFATHQTSHLLVTSGEGNMAMIERVVPTDAGPQSNVCLWVDVLKTKVMDYERDIDGSYKLDVNGDKVEVGEIDAGHVVRWSTTFEADVPGLGSKFGKQVSAPGTLVDAVDPLNTSTRYPVAEFKIGYQGEFGNNIGLRMWQPTMNGMGDFDQRIMRTDGVYPFRVQVIERNPATGTARIKNTYMGDGSILSTFKKNIRSKVTTEKLSFNDNFLSSYDTTNDPRYPAILGDFGQVAIYDNNIQTLLKDFYEAEKTYLDAAVTPVESDFTSEPGFKAGEEWLFNMMGGTTYKGVPYHSYVLDNTTPESVVLSDLTNIYAKGGSDGTMSSALFDDLVGERIVGYADENSHLQNTAKNVESWFYDSGFSLTTKYKLMSFIASRKNTILVLATHVYGEDDLSASEDNSRAIALRSRVRLFPESEYWGTAAARCIIMGRSGRYRNLQIAGKVSTSFELGRMCARYMGSGDGVWKSGKHFDGGEGAILKEMYDIAVTYTPISVRNRDWDAGLNYAMDFDRRSAFFPALKTVYDDDTSVLTGLLTVAVIAEINTVMENAWRRHTGTQRMTNGVLCESVDNYIRDDLEGRFDDRFVIVPESEVTKSDEARGYSWHTRVKVYGPGMKTVMQAYTETFRLEDLVAQ